MKKLHSLELNSGPLHMWQVFCHWTIKADTKDSHISKLFPFRTSKDSFLPVTFNGLADLFPQPSHKQLCGNSVYWLWRSNVKILTTVAWVLCSNPGCEFYYFFHADILGRLGSNLVFIVPLGNSYVEFGIKVWLVPFGIM
jgi:hypothetical protein